MSAYGISSEDLRKEYSYIPQINKKDENGEFVISNDDLEYLLINLSKSDWKNDYDYSDKFILTTDIKEYKEQKYKFDYTIFTETWLSNNKVWFFGFDYGYESTYKK